MDTATTPLAAYFSLAVGTAPCWLPVLLHMQLEPPWIHTCAAQSVTTKVWGVLRHHHTQRLGGAAEVISIGCHNVQIQAIVADLPDVLQAGDLGTKGLEHAMFQTS